MLSKKGISHAPKDVADKPRTTKAALAAAIGRRQKNLAAEQRAGRDSENGRAQDRGASQVENAGQGLAHGEETAPSGRQATWARHLRGPICPYRSAHLKNQRVAKSFSANESGRTWCTSKMRADNASGVKAGEFIGLA